MIDMESRRRNHNGIKLRTEPDRRNEVPPENLLNDIMDLLKQANSTEEIVKSLKIKDD